MNKKPEERRSGIHKNAHDAADLETSNFGIIETPADTGVVPRLRKVRGLLVAFALRVIGHCGNKA